MHESNNQVTTEPIILETNKKLSVKNKMSTFEDDESFYDVAEEVDSNDDLVIINNKLKKILAKENSVFGESIEKFDDLDDESNGYTTAISSRHISEINSADRLKSNQSVSINNLSDIEHENSTVNEENIDKEREEEEEDETEVELETPWTFYIDTSVQRGASKQEYEAAIKFVYTVKSIQEFWAVFNYIPDVDKLPNRYGYFVMRNNRRPLWEDENNRLGGIWTFRCKKENTSIVWSEILLAGIGEQLSECVAWPNDDIVGFGINKREKEDIVQIWNTNCNFTEEATIIQKVSDLLPNITFSSTHYKAHSEHDAYDKLKSSVSAKVHHSRHFNSDHHTNNISNSGNHVNRNNISNGSSTKNSINKISKGNIDK